MTSVLCLVTISMIALTAAQEHDHASMLRNAKGGTTSLTAEQVAELLAGDGMGLAKAAELNHYPGPKHVLELANELALTTEQQSRVAGIRSEMLQTARKLGAEIVDAERTLDMLFANAHMTEDLLRTLTGTIAKLQGDLRAVHLAAHVATRQMLTPDQIKRYDIVRGYTK